MHTLVTAINPNKAYMHFKSLEHANIENYDLIVARCNNPALGKLNDILNIVCKNVNWVVGRCAYLQMATCCRHSELKTLKIVTVNKQAYIRLYSYKQDIYRDIKLLSEDVDFFEEIISAMQANKIPDRQAFRSYTSVEFGDYTKGWRDFHASASHFFRHVGATRRFILTNNNLKDVSAFMGHASVEITKDYISLLPYLN